VVVVGTSRQRFTARRLDAARRAETETIAISLWDFLSLDLDLVVLVLVDFVVVAAASNLPTSEQKGPQCTHLHCRSSLA
jgi:hypothetical protein